MSPVGHLPRVDVVVADVAHEAGELAECVRFPLAVAGQPVAQRGGDRTLKLRGMVAIDKHVHPGRCRPQALSGGVPGALDGGAEQVRGRQEHAAPVGLDRLAEAALGPRSSPRLARFAMKTSGPRPQRPCRRSRCGSRTTSESTAGWFSRRR
jgi:hypothetical protein